MKIKWTGLAIMSFYLKTLLTFRANITIQILLLGAKVLFAYILWSAIYDQNGKIGGFSFENMMLYYVLVTGIIGIDSAKEMGYKISDEIQRGVFSKYMILPISPSKYFLYEAMGKNLLHGVIVVLSSILWIVLFKIPFQVNENWIELGIASWFVILGLVFLTLFHYMFALFAFLIQDTTTFFMIRDNILGFLLGGVIPFVLLPDQLTQLLKCLPFYYIAYYPALIAGNLVEPNCWFGSLIMLIWISILWFLVNWMYQTFRIKYEGVGL